MKILIDLTALSDNFSGIERFAANIAYEMIKKSEHTFVLVFKESIHPMFEDAQHKPYVETVVIPRCGKLFFNQIRLPAVLRKISADVYIFLAFPIPLFLHKKHMISAIHDACCWDCPDTMKSGAKWYYRISYRMAARKCSYIITVSEFSRQRIIARLGIPQDLIKVIYCAAQQSFFCNNVPNAEKKRICEKYSLPDEYIFSLSTIEPRKNIRSLILSYSRLVSEGKIDLPLVLAGRNGWKNNGLIDDIPPQISSKIIFTGFIDEVDLAAVFAGARYFVFPSLYEGFGIPPLEAMACGVPVLSSNAGSMPEILRDAAVYFDVEDMKTLDSSLVYMNTMGDKCRSEIIKRGLALAARYRWEDETEKIFYLLNGMGS